ncbi:MAG: hypothetical protein WCY29_13320 [Novosphingobium sp.]
MGGDSEYEPRDSRNVTGTARTPDGRWSGDKQKPGHGGEYEPRDSRNVTGTASTRDGRWTNVQRAPPLAAGGHERLPTPEEVVGEDEEEDTPVEKQRR